VVIKDAAEALILRVADRVDKPFAASDNTGKISVADSVVHSIDARDTLILYRNHSIRQEFEQDLIDAGVPYINHNGRPAPLKSALAALIMELEKVPDISFVNRSIAWGLDKWWPQSDVHKYQDGKLSLIDFVSRANWKGDVLFYLTNLMKTRGFLSDIVPKVKISTIHGAKGREAEHVILINSTTANSLEGWENDRENEIRVWYVGMTRAKSELTIVEYENPVELL
jgi:superfamily I DNA/RNA helicase